MTGDYHVIKRGKKWHVKRAGAARASRVFPKKVNAIQYATDKAEAYNLSVYLHGDDGRIERRIISKKGGV